MTVNTTLDDSSGDGGALRRDVSFLGALLGDVLREQGGDELFDIVETARLAARARRDGPGRVARGSAWTRLSARVT